MAQKNDERCDSTCSRNSSECDQKSDCPAHGPVGGRSEIFDLTPEISDRSVEAHLKDLQVRKPLGEIRLIGSHNVESSRDAVFFTNDLIDPIRGAPKRFHGFALEELGSALRFYEELKPIKNAAQGRIECDLGGALILAGRAQYKLTTSRRRGRDYRNAPEVEFDSVRQLDLEGVPAITDPITTQIDASHVGRSRCYDLPVQECAHL
jgi:hypothetical protein